MRTGTGHLLSPPRPRPDIEFICTHNAIVGNDLSPDLSATIAAPILNTRNIVRSALPLPRSPVLLFTLFRYPCLSQDNLASSNMILQMHPEDMYKKRAQQNHPRNRRMQRAASGAEHSRLQRSAALKLSHTEPPPDPPAASQHDCSTPPNNRGCCSTLLSVGCRG